MELFAESLKVNGYLEYLEDNKEQHITVTASNQQDALKKVKQQLGVIPSRAFLIKD